MEVDMPYNILGDLQSLTLSENAACDNPCTILTLDCLVTLMGDITLNSYVAGSTFATLEESLRPTYEIYAPVCAEEQLSFIKVSPMGELSLPIDFSGTLHTNGITFNVCDTYYNSNIDNNYPQGTSPLRYDYTNEDDWYDGWDDEPEEELEEEL